MAKITNCKYYILRDIDSGETVVRPANLARWAISKGLTVEIGTTILRMTLDEYNELSEGQRRELAIKQWQAEQQGKVRQ
jgi:hypothetical protein